MQKDFKLIVVALVAASIVACGGGGTGSGTAEGNETAAKVNGKVITMEEVDRGVKAQAQGQQARFSPLELAGARLQVLDQIIQQEVMFQKAEKESAVPSEDDITVEINKQKTASGKTADQIDKDMKEQGMTEAALRDQIKKVLAIQKLTDKITGKIEAPKDSEITAFYEGNKDAFVKKRGVKLAAIIIDPANTGSGDTTTDDQSAAIKGNEVVKKLQSGQDFASLAREYSEDQQSKLQGGDLGYIAEDELKQMFPAAIAADLMNPATQAGKMEITQAQGKFFILKLQERSDREEALTLESPGVREQVQKSLVDNRKQLLAASYQAIAMNEAKVENFLARKVVDNPNELSGARPAGAANLATPAPASTAPAGNSNIAANTNSAPSANTGSNAAAQPAGNAAAKPAASPKAAAPANKPAANAPANK